MESGTWFAVPNNWIPTKWPPKDHELHNNSIPIYLLDNINRALALSLLQNISALQQLPLLGNNSPFFSFQMTSKPTNLLTWAWALLPLILFFSPLPIEPRPTPSSSLPKEIHRHPHLHQAFGFIKKLKGCHKGETVQALHLLKHYLEKFGYLPHHSEGIDDDSFDDLFKSSTWKTSPPFVPEPSPNGKRYPISLSGRFKMSTLQISRSDSFLGVMGINHPLTAWAGHLHMRSRPQGDCSISTPMRSGG